MSKIPVALFVYNRLSHTKATISALADNDLRDVVLYIFSDGPKGEDHNSVSSLRAYLHTITGFEEIIIIKASTNKGLARSIIEGVNYIFETFETVIVLEDDLVVSKHFITYMRKSLHKYRDNQRVMSIAGYSYPLFDSSENRVGDTYFLRLTTSWGWGTWRSSWGRFDKNPDRLINSFSRQDIREFNLNNSENYWNQVLNNHRGTLNTWAIFWYATVFENHGLTLFPRMSLVNNIGFDGSGTNCGVSNRFDVHLRQGEIDYLEDNVVENVFVREELERYLRATRPKFISRILSYLLRYFH